MKTQEEKDIDAWANMFEQVTMYPWRPTSYKDISDYADISAKRLRRLRGDWPEFDRVLEQFMERNKQMERKRAANK